MAVLYFTDISFLGASLTSPNMFVYNCIMYIHISLSLCDLTYSLCPGLGDPWGATSSDPPPPSYDMVATGGGPSSTVDPWGGPSAPAMNQGPPVDPWGGSASNAPTATATTGLGSQSTGMIE